jgi:predicted ATPase
LSFLGRFVGQLRRRRVIRSTLIYAGLAWVAIQVVDVVVPALGGPDWVVRVSVALLLLGLPVAVVVSWIFDFDPGRLRLDVTPDEAEAIGAERVDQHAETGRISIPPPTPGNALVGRDDHVERVAGSLRRGSRLVTITGPGGVGKTRLAMAVASSLENAFVHGVAFVPLADATDVDEVLPIVARTLGVAEAKGRSALDALVVLLSERHVLLVLDNLEQVIGAAGHVADLLARCPRLHVLATSRSPLRVGAETEYPLPTLDLPPSDGDAGVGLDGYAATALFMDRARRARADLVLTPDDEAAVVQICRRLDGLPLAIELAAARMRILEPAALLQRLDHSLDVLTAGARDQPGRHQALRATIAWSHSLLAGEEQRLFRRLAVFAGGWTHDAVEAVCFDAASSSDLDCFESLVEHALVRPVGTGRFDMLQTIREYAQECLGDSGEAEALGRRHAEHYVNFFERIDTGITDGEQLASLALADSDAANLEAALEWLRMRAVDGDVDALQLGLRLCGALWLYWHIRGRNVSAGAWAEVFLAAPGIPAQSPLRVRALMMSALATFMLGDGVRARATFLAGYELARQSGDARQRIILGVSIGFTHLVAGEVDEARKWLEEAIEDCRRGDPDWSWGFAFALSFKGLHDAAAGNIEAAEAAFIEALAVQESLGDFEGGGLSHSGLGAVAAARGDHEQALKHYDDAVDAYRRIGDRPEEARVLDEMAWVALAHGTPDRARTAFLESLQAYEEVDSMRGVGIALSGLAAAEAVDDRPDRSIRLAAAAETFSQRAGIVAEYVAGSSRAAPHIERARQSLAAADAARLEAEGRLWSLKEAVQFAASPA